MTEATLHACIQPWDEVYPLDFGSDGLLYSLNLVHGIPSYNILQQGPPPILQDLMLDDLRWSWCIIIMEIKGTIYGGFSGDSVIKNLPAKQETQVWSLGQKDPQRRKWQPTAVFLPRKSHGQKSLEGYSHRVTRVVDNLATKQQQQLPNKCNVFESSPNHPSCPGPWNNYLP